VPLTPPSIGPTVPLAGAGVSSANPPPSHQPLRDDQSIDHYKIVRLLSKGGQGALYLAIDHGALDQQVVIKEIVLDTIDPRDPQAVVQAQERLKEEAETLKDLKHLNIPKIFRFFSVGVSNYIVMEYIEGPNLEDALAQKRQPFSEQDAAQWGISLCKVLEYLAHRTPPVVHRDIKPANIILEANSAAVRLVDFGIAKAHLTRQLGGTSRRVTSRFGTIGYAPIEQFSGHSEPRSDVYALAATLYHLATGDDPRDHPFEFSRWRVVSRAFRAALEPALEQTVARRCTATQLREALENVVKPAITRPALQARDGTDIANEQELAAWCERQWDMAAEWLYGDLPEQVKNIWAKNHLADHMRQIVGGHPQDRNIGVDMLVRLLDPSFPAPKVQVSPSRLSYGPLALDQRATRRLALKNAGRGYVVLSLSGRSWLTPAVQVVCLRAGQSGAVEVNADMSHQRIGGNLKARLDIVAQNGFSQAIAATATLPRWRTFWQRYLQPFVELQTWQSAAVRAWKVATAALAAGWTVAALVGRTLGHMAVRVIGVIWLILMALSHGIMRGAVTAILLVPLTIGGGAIVGGISSLLFAVIIRTGEGIGWQILYGLLSGLIGIGAGVVVSLISGLISGFVITLIVEALKKADLIYISRYRRNYPSIMVSGAAIGALAAYILIFQGRLGAIALALFERTIPDRAAELVTLGVIWGALAGLFAGWIYAELRQQ